MVRASRSSRQKADLLGESLDAAVEPENEPSTEPAESAPVAEPSLGESVPRRVRSKSPASKYGVPQWRVGKPDAIIAQAVSVARDAVLTIAKSEHIGAHLGAKSEGERVATHLFDCLLPGYAGWQWFAVLARVPRGRVATVSEVGLVPSEKSVLAPEWLPWSERIRPGDQEAFDAGLADGVEPADGADSAEDAGLVDGDEPVEGSEHGDSADDGAQASDEDARVSKPRDTHSAEDEDETSESPSEQDQPKSKKSGKGKSRARRRKTPLKK